jgi:hypothetical protein
VSEDPLGFGAGDLNLHAYVSNDPANVVDPTGEFGLAGCAIGAGLALLPHLPDLLNGRGCFPLSDIGIGCLLGGIGLPPLLRRLPNLPRLPRLGGGPRVRRPGSYRPPEPLPRGKNGQLAPSSPYSHTQIGTKNGSRGPYTAAREFGENGRPIRDIHFTDHGRPAGHPNPHQHRWTPNPSGGTPIRNSAEPYRW